MTSISQPTRSENESVEEWLKRIELNINSIIQSSNDTNRLLDHTLCGNTSHGEIFTERFKVDNGLTFLKINTPEVNVIMPANHFNSKFNECFKDGAFFNSSKLSIHGYNTRCKHKYLNDYMTVTINYSVNQWEDSGFFENHDVVLKGIMKFLESFHPYIKNITDWDAFEDIPVIIHTDHLSETGNMMFYTSPIGMARAIVTGAISDIITNIHTGFNNVDISEEPERMTMFQYNDLIGVRNSTKADTCHTCSICMEDIKLRLIISVTKCGHYFHSKCLKRWLVNKCSKPRCPCCREKLSD